jgi:hypothetical protein
MFVLGTAGFLFLLWFSCRYPGKTAKHVGNVEMNGTCETSGIEENIRVGEKSREGEGGGSEKRS